MWTPQGLPGGVISPPKMYSIFNGDIEPPANVFNTLVSIHVSPISYSCCKQNKMHVGALNSTPIVIFWAMPDYKINEEGPHYLWPLKTVRQQKKRPVRTKKTPQPIIPHCFWRFMEDSNTAECPLFL